MKIEKWVLDTNIDKVKARFDKLVKKARKLDVTPPSIKITDEQKVAKIIVEHTGRKVDALFTKVEVEGDVPHYGGWSFIAKIDHFKNGDDPDKFANIISSPDFLTDDLKGVYDALSKAHACSEPNCDHCNTSRDRNSTYLLHNPDEKPYFIQLGGTCLDSYLPEHDISKTLFAFSSNSVFLGMDTLDGANFDLRDRPVSTKLILAIAAQSVAESGFKPSSMVNSTKEYMLDQFFRAAVRLNPEAGKIINDFEAGKENKWLGKAQDIIDYFKDCKESGSFILNCKSISTFKYITGKGAALGTACAMPKVFDDNNSVEFNNDGFFAEKKKRGFLKLKVIKKMDNDFDDYPSTSYFLLDDNNRKFDFKSYYGDAFKNLDLDTTYLMKATISDHYVDKAGNNVNRINRIANLEICSSNHPTPEFEKKKKKRSKESSECSR